MPTETELANQPADTIQQQPTLKYSSESEAVFRLSSEWETERNHAKLRRKFRRDDINVEDERQREKIGPDQTFIPFRAIDQAITQAKPSLVSFLQQSRRFLIFKDMLEPGAACEDLEIAFTDWMKYDDWQVDWHRSFDAQLLHGGVALEVIFDETKPLKCCVQYIRREDLIFHLKTKKLQQQERIIRVYYYLPYELEEMVATNQFNSAEVSKLVRQLRESKRDEAIRVFKVYKKIQGRVWVYWMADKGYGEDYLKLPEPLKIGLYDVSQDADMIKQDIVNQQMTQQPGLPPPEIPQLPVKNYPIFYFLNELIEDEKLIKTKGLAARLLPVQEALTQLWTCFVNATIKASSIYGSVENIPGEDPASQETINFKGDQLLAKKANFWYFPSPDPVGLQVANALLATSQQQQGQVDYTALNRKDSRKTAEEMRAAMSVQQSLSAVDVVTESQTIRDVYKLCWLIGQSQIWLGNIPCSPDPGFPISRDKVLRPYKLTAAGDIDFVQRQEKKSLIQQVFPIMAQTPAAMLFMKFMLDNFFPEEAAKWEQMLQAGNPQQLLQACLPILQEVLNSQQLPPDQHAQLTQLIQMVTTAAGAATQQGLPSQPAQPVAHQPNNQPTPPTTANPIRQGPPASPGMQQGPATRSA